MKSVLWTCVTAMAVLATLAVPVQVTAQDQQEHNQQNNYSVFDLGTLGGTSSGASSINNLSWVSGFSDTTDERSVHAALWAYGFKFDLGTLGGVNSAVNWNVHNNRGQIVGISEISNPDPLGETWSCYFGSAGLGSGQSLSKNRACKSPSCCDRGPVPCSDFHLM